MKKLQSLGKSLSKNEQKKIFGGVVDPEGDGSGGCCAHYSEAPENEEWCCGLTKAQAQAKAASMPGDGKWCCASCQGHASVNCAS